MRLLKSIIGFLILILFSFIIVSGEINDDIWLGKFVSVFEQSGAKFDFFEMKSSIIISREYALEELEEACVEIVEKFDINKDELKIKRNKNKLYVNYNSKNTVISIVGVTKISRETYILVDILQNKVYKNIENNYHILEKVMLKYSNKVDINVCIAGEYTKILQNIKKDDILNEILYNMYAKEIDRVEDVNFTSVTAYSNLLSKNNIKYLDKDINLNIGFRYSEDEDITKFYMATPIIKIDY